MTREKGCQWCMQGSYQDAPGMNYCMKCKRGMISKEVGAMSAKACRNCARGKYAVNSTECVDCPLNTVSPSGAYGVLECSAMSGHYAIPGGIGMECPVNHYCVQGTTEPTPCPQGTISATSAIQCFPGIRSVVFLDWLFGSAWIIVFLGGVIALGMYKQMLSKTAYNAQRATGNRESLTPSLSLIQIKIAR